MLRARWHSCCRSICQHERRKAKTVILHRGQDQFPIPRPTAPFRQAIGPKPIPRRNRVHRHATRRTFLGERLGETDDTGLGGRVVGLAHVARDARDRHLDAFEYGAWAVANITLIGIDRDPEAMERAWAHAGKDPRVIPAAGRFGEIEQILHAMNRDQVDGIMLDLGVSSPQLDDPARGFSLRGAGPLFGDFSLNAANVLTADAFLGLGLERITPTYDLNAAAASAWLIKAGRASSTTETDPNSFCVTSTIFDNCCEMARIYRAKGKMSLSVAQVRV